MSGHSFKLKRDISEYQQEQAAKKLKFELEERANKINSYNERRNQERLIRAEENKASAMSEQARQQSIANHNYKIIELRKNPIFISPNAKKRR